MTAFLLIAALLTVTPGADMALVTRTALAGASSFGLSLVLQRSPQAFRIVQALGAAYLMWLGFQALREALASAGGDAGSGAGSPVAAGAPRSRRAFADGLFTNLLNPKVAAFYLGFLPQFVPAGANALGYCLLLAGIHIAMGFAWLLFYASAVERLSAALGAARVRRRLQALTGAALLGLGLKLAFSERGR